MGIVKRKVNGKWRYGVSRRLPHNKLGIRRFRRWYQNRTIAQNVLDRLSGAIAIGMLDSVLPGLVGAAEATTTVEKFWERFRDEYCKPRLSSWKRYELSFRSINAAVGRIALGEFRRQDLHGYIQKRKGSVSDSTINKDIAAVKKMFSYALEVGAVEHHPLVRFPGIRVQEKPLRLPTIEEYRRLVDAMPDPVIGALVAVLGETGFRKSEGLTLVREQVDWQGGRIRTEQTKGKKVRSIPLSDFAMAKLRALVPFAGTRHVFVHQQPSPKAGKAWSNPDKVFRAGRKAAGLEWITFHTLRHMRATNWLHQGVDIRSVQKLLDHSDIRTTMKYLKYIESHADMSVREAQAKEEQALKKSAEREENG
jgi:integrase/recombinase XerD